MRQRGFAPIIILLILVVVALMGVAYLAGSKDLLTNKVPITWNSSPSPSSVSGQTADWKTYTTEDKKFSIKYPPDWTLIDGSKKVDLYNDGNFQLSQDISISKNGHIFRSYNPLAWGPGVCIFPDSPKFEGPSQEFSDFVELESISGVYRRPKTPILQQDGKNYRFTICAKEVSSGNFTNVVGFGTTWYEVPTKYDPQLILVLDKIFSTFKSN